MTSLFTSFHGPAAPLFAMNLWSWVGYFSNPGSRGAVITLCVAIVAISLFILMGATKK